MEVMGNFFGGTSGIRGWSVVFSWIF